jgi:hypothetical protein
MDLLIQINGSDTVSCFAIVGRPYVVLSASFSALSAFPGSAPTAADPALFGQFETLDMIANEAPADAVIVSLVLLALALYEIWDAAATRDVTFRLQHGN